MNTGSGMNPNKGGGLRGLIACILALIIVFFAFKFVWERGGFRKLGLTAQNNINGQVAPEGSGWDKFQDGYYAYWVNDSSYILLYYGFGSWYEYDPNDNKWLWNTKLSADSLRKDTVYLGQTYKKNFGGKGLDLDIYG